MALSENAQQSWKSSSDQLHASFLASFLQLLTVVVLLGVTAFGAIRIRKNVLPFGSYESTPSLGSSIGSARHYYTTSLPTICCRLFAGVVRIFKRNVWKKCCVKIPQRFRNFYINALLIPSYRKEWGKYQTWSYQSPLRPEKSARLRSHLREMKSRFRKDDKKISQRKTLPKPVAHNHAYCQHVRINVSGCIYQTQLRTLNRFPETLLGNANLRYQYYNPAADEYFFDRNRFAFETILYYYQSGGYFKRPDNLALDILLDDMKFFRLPRSVIYQFLCDEGLSAMSNDSDEVLPRNHFQRKIWLLFEHPQSSIQAQVLSLISVTAIVLSISTLIIETLESFEENEGCVLLKGAPDGMYKCPHIKILQDPFQLTESVCNLWFLVEYLTRLISSPVKSEFLISKLNFIDLVAIFPWLIEIIDPRTVLKDTTGSLAVIKIVRLVRVFRIFKLSRHSFGLKILGKTLQASLHELMLLVFFIVMGVVFFASAVYFADKRAPNSHFESIPDAFWWALITITTVGYGGVNPVTPLGKFVGSLCAVVGVLTLALPVPVIVSNFNFFYQQELGVSDMSWLRISHTPQCPFRPMDVAGEKFHSEKPAKKKRHRHRKTVNHHDSLVGELPGKTRSDDQFSSDQEFSTLKKKKLDVVM